jgi:hypothetical protein
MAEADCDPDGRPLIYRCGSCHVRGFSRRVMRKVCSEVSGNSCAAPILECEGDENDR